MDRRGSSETPGIWLGFVDSTERYRGAAQSSDQVQKFSLDVGRAFELPLHAPHGYRAHSPWVSDQARLRSTCALDISNECCSAISGAHA